MPEKPSNDYLTVKEVYAALTGILARELGTASYSQDRRISLGLAHVKVYLERDATRVSSDLHQHLVTVLERISECIELEKCFLGSDVPGLEESLNKLNSIKKRVEKEYNRAVPAFNVDFNKAIGINQTKLKEVYDKEIDKAKSFRRQSGFDLKSPSQTINNWFPKKLRRAMEKFQKEQDTRVEKKRENITTETMRQLVLSCQKMVQRGNSLSERFDTEFGETGIRDKTSQSAQNLPNSSEKLSIMSTVVGAGIGGSIGMGSVAAGAATTTAAVPWTFGLLTVTTTSLTAAAAWVAAPLMLGACAVKIGIDARSRHGCFKEFDMYIAAIEAKYSSELKNISEQLQARCDGCIKHLLEERDKNLASIDAEIERSLNVVKTRKISREARRLQVFISEWGGKLNDIATRLGDTVA